ncbi:hypothetical protein MBUL_02251 [Methylobacterium bullatum]|uniref:Uncharacterized protein n=1 Tax=Methylobacterium bullatum TaxID=570505 RepID=A0A679IV63_9HYPH|nr:hypothetical protein MBUL_02251 [Methylobacterium bullatum]
MHEVRYMWKHYRLFIRENEYGWDIRYYTPAVL